jgi:hypothetical protein
MKMAKGSLWNNANNFSIFALPACSSLAAERGCRRRPHNTTCTYVTKLDSTPGSEAIAFLRAVPDSVLGWKKSKNQNRQIGDNGKINVKPRHTTTFPVIHKVDADELAEP